MIKGVDATISEDKGTISICGDLDSEFSASMLSDAFELLCQKGARTIVLDLREVELINAYGISKILLCEQRMRADRGVLMVKPLAGYVKETFERLKIDSLLPIDNG